jgi:hypothetical protein
MNTCLLITLLAAQMGDVSVYTPTQAASQLSREVQTGSLIFSRGDCLAVKAYSASRYTHVATVVVLENGIYCYDATAGVGVRKQRLENYVRSQGEASLHPFHPLQSMTDEQATQFKFHLESQLGRPYGIAHHVTGRRAEGIHCAEYATDALIACDLLRANEPARVSPASLVQGILNADLYLESDAIQLAPDAVPVRSDEGCCARFWRETCSCTGYCYRRMRGWFCCK